MPTRYEVWKQYEKVAIHFNDLLMRLRSQSLGGVAILAAIAGAVAHGDITAQTRWQFMSGAFLLLSALWIAVWILDFLYYGRLLEGAVRAILALEADGAPDAVIEKLDLSGAIERAVAGRPLGHAHVRAISPLSGGKARWAFYILVLATLIAGGLLSFVLSRSSAASGVSL